MGWFFVGLLMGGGDSPLSEPPPGTMTEAIIGGMALLLFASYVLYKLGEHIWWLWAGERASVADMRARGWHWVKPAWRDRVAARLTRRQETCEATFTDRSDGHRLYVCELAPRHIGPHKDEDCEWSDGDHYWGQTAVSSDSKDG